jgi:dUTP pyrophosphatase
MFNIKERFQSAAMPSKEETQMTYKEPIMNVKVKKVLENAVLPIRGSDGAAGFDLTAATEVFKPEKTGPIFEYDTGLAFEIPKGYVGLVFPRSSVTTKTTLSLGNAVGVIDSDYRGTVKFQYRNNHIPGKKYNVGDRIGQIIILPIPTVNFEEVSELNDTKRGEQGFGSTGQ